MHGRAAPAPNAAKAYKNLDELLAQLRASFYTGPMAEPAASEPRAAKDALAEADKLGAARGAGGQAAAPQPSPPEPEYEEYDDGLGAHRLAQLCCRCCIGLLRSCCLQTAALRRTSVCGLSMRPHLSCSRGPLI